jgi:gamma-glutamyltranspeptidase/glutathione hydrolase
MSQPITRRRVLQLAGAGAAAGWWRRQGLSAPTRRGEPRGRVIGEPTAEKIGEQVLADGGNAFDAMVAAALAAAVAAPNQTGIGGYGGCATLALAGTRKFVSLDFNSMAPGQARADMFQPGTDGKVASKNHGWRAAGVPGILAGLQLLIDRHGTRKFGELVQPAIRLARDGFVVTSSLAGAIKAAAAQFSSDAGSRKLYFRDGEPIRAGERFRNLELADMLTTLAQRGSVDSFYRGDIAGRIADAFQKNGGLVTADDMALYEAREVSPLSVHCGGCAIHTAPLATGGLTVLQVLQTLEALRWSRLPAGVGSRHAQIEAMRLAWQDRLTRLGDPEFSAVPVERLLSLDYARECAARIESAVKSGTLLAHPVTPRAQGGTISLSAADTAGNFIALTLTHGEGFGARVTIDGLGLTLGHGMTRFEPDPKHPNAPGPRKRPLHNMCPTIVCRADQPILAIGGRGGRRIPNALIETLAQFVLLECPLQTSIAAPRLHTEGNASLQLEKHWPATEIEPLSTAPH